MPNKSLVVITLEEHPQLSLEELCNACDVTPEFIQSLIEYGVLEPEGESSTAWRFDSAHLHRIKVIVRLQHDLEVNIAGAAMIVDLMDQMEEMRVRLELFEKSFK
jgi:chaperone modulatory protein CbpM